MKPHGIRPFYRHSTAGAAHRGGYLLATFLAFAFQGVAHAYIGPGAGFAVVGSFFAIFVALLAGVFALFTWPLRALIRAIRGRHSLRHSRIKRCVILGLDGMDYRLTERFLAEGKLPNFAKLRERGCFKPLATTFPAISPVAWSSFQTGVNPGKHHIFDFLTRDRRTYQPKLSSVDIRGVSRTISLGKYQIPLGKPEIRLLRKSVPFWKILSEHGIFSGVLRVPITFPPEKFHGVLLSGMCVPDLRGTQGTFSYYTTEVGAGTAPTGGEVCPVVREGNTVRAELVGSVNPFRRDGSELTCPFVVTIHDGDSATLEIHRKRIPLKRDVTTDWIRVHFRAAPGIAIHGICKFLLLSTEPEFRLYVTPIHIDPERPAMPVAYPTVYSTYLAKRQGAFATLGLAEDTWALNEKILSDEAFIEQCVSFDQEREAMFFDLLDKIRRGLCVCVFDGTDRLQHTFWRDLDPQHPAHQASDASRHVIEDLYQRMDALVGKTLERCDDEDTLLMVISDHGFSAFRRGIDLNRWLEENGYLTVKEAARGEKHLAAVDWSQTRAFALGLAGIFLNLKGRESQGIVEPTVEAPKLRREIAERLRRLEDPATGHPAIKEVYDAWEIYQGPYRDDAPDLIVGYEHGYRASWETAVGQITDAVFHDNTKAWSGDHCIDPKLVPGVLFCNRPIETENPRLLDIAPTVLTLFGVEVPDHMDGRPLVVADGR